VSRATEADASERTAATGGERVDWHEATRTVIRCVTELNLLLESANRPCRSCEMKSRWQQGRGGRAGSREQRWLCGCDKH
jgi:hypothetical protein